MFGGDNFVLIVSLQSLGKVVRLPQVEPPDFILQDVGEDWHGTEGEDWLPESRPVGTTRRLIPTPSGLYH